MSTFPTRRAILKTAAASAIASFSGRRILAAADSFPPVRAITRGPKFHWFGYYDKLQFDPTGRHVLGMEVDFEHRSPKAEDVIRIGLINTAAGDTWTEIGQSTAWGWQQGCMLQWVPGSDRLVLWNDRQEGQYVCHVLDVKSKQKRTIPSPIYTLSPDGKSAVTPDFSRISDVRPGYGYAGIPDAHADDPAPKDSGIFHVQLATGTRRLILPLADVVKFGPQSDTMKGAKHWFNHLLYNTDGSRFVFLHRWRPAGAKMGVWHTRMLSATPDGKDLQDRKSVV